MVEDPGERIQKYLARCGLGSRRKCDDMVTREEVIINDRTAVPGDRVKAEDVVTVNGKHVVPLNKAYYVVNKPMGYVCSNVREKGWKRVIDLIPDGEKMGLFTVGRLDVGTSGLVLVTNDGALANRVAHPSMGVKKEYIVEVKGDVGKHETAMLVRGVDIGSGRVAKAVIKKMKKKGETTKLWVEVHEGRFHLVRRMLSSLDKEVVSLVRIRVGPVALGKLAPGDHRILEPRLVDMLLRDET